MQASSPGPAAGMPPVANGAPNTAGQAWAGPHLLHREPATPPDGPGCPYIEEYS